MTMRLWKRLWKSLCRRTTVHLGMKCILVVVVFFWETFLSKIPVHLPWPASFSLSFHVPSPWVDDDHDRAIVLCFEETILLFSEEDKKTMSTKRVSWEEKSVCRTSWSSSWDDIVSCQAWLEGCFCSVCSTFILLLRHPRVTCNPCLFRRVSLSSSLGHHKEKEDSFVVTFDCQEDPLHACH